MGQAPYTCYAILPHPAEPLILLLPGSGGWALPRVEITAPTPDSWWREVAALNTAIGRQLGRNVTTLYCAQVGANPTVPEGVFVLENHDADRSAPGGGRWIGAPVLDAIPLAVPAHRTLLADWFAEADGRSASPVRPDWAQPGWFRSAADWIEEQLNAHEITSTGPVEQLRTWFLSCILRVPTVQGDVYCKAAPPSYAYEPLLTQALAREYPGRVPRVPAVDASRRWLLMQGVDGVKLRQHPDTARYMPRWEALLRDMACIQRDYTSRVDELRAWGCPDRRPASLAAEIDTLFAELPTLLPGTMHGVSAEQLARVQALAPRLKEMCAALDGYGIPPTLNHGDFHSGNILANDRECVLLDWAGFVAVAHPFFCLSVVFEEHTDPAVRDQLRDVYLEGWTDYAPMPRLREAVDLALPLGVVYGALGHRHQLTFATTTWDRMVEQGNLAYCLRMLLSFFA